MMNCYAVVSVDSLFIEKQTVWCCVMESFSCFLVICLVSFFIDIGTANVK